MGSAMPTAAVAPLLLRRHGEEEEGRSPPPLPKQRLTRLLVNVTVDRSQLWPVHVVVGADGTVADLARAAVAEYAREGRRPPLPPPAAAAADDDNGGFELHYSKYSLDALDPDEKVADLGSRNFFLCAARKRRTPSSSSSSSAAAAIV